MAERRGGPGEPVLRRAGKGGGEPANRCGCSPEGMRSHSRRPPRPGLSPAHARPYRRPLAATPLPSRFEPLPRLPSLHPSLPPSPPSSCSFRPARLLPCRAYSLRAPAVFSCRSGRYSQLGANPGSPLPHAGLYTPIMPSQLLGRRKRPIQPIWLLPECTAINFSLFNISSQVGSIQHGHCLRSSHAHRGRRRRVRTLFAVVGVAISFDTSSTLSTQSPPVF